MSRSHPLLRPVLSVAALTLALVIGGCASGSKHTSQAGSSQETRPRATVGRAPASSTTRSPAPAPATTTTTTSTSTAPPPTTAPLPRESGDLAGGAKGSRTRALQQALHDQHYDPGAIDGQFGLKTTQSVWAWQALHGLPRTGVVTPDVERLVLAATVQPMLRPDLGPSHTEIDLSRQVLLLFKNGRAELITHVSTGSRRHYCDKGNCGTAITPTGSFRYQRRVSGWRHAPLGLLYNPVYFNGGIAVHGANSVPNYPASHGCVRIPMHIAQYFPDLVAKGDPVVVV